MVRNLARSSLAPPLVREFEESLIRIIFEGVSDCLEHKMSGTL